MPNVIVNGARLNYVQLSEGNANDHREDLVMVHGLAANIAFWYFKYACELAKDFRVTVFDLRGHGRSEMTPTGYAPVNLARDMAALMDELNIGKAHIVAHSFGGVIAMNFALRHPERIRSLVLADTHIAAARHVKDSREWAYGQTIQAIMDRHGFELDARDPYFGYKLLTRAAQLQLDGDPVPPELMDLVNPLTNNAGGRTAAQWLRLMQFTSAEAEMMGDDGLSLESLRSFSFPIIAMYGDRSPARLTGTELLDVWPHAEFRNVRNAGHFFPASPGRRGSLRLPPVLAGRSRAIAAPASLRRTATGLLSERPHLQGFAGLVFHDARAATDGTVRRVRRRQRNPPRCGAE